MIQEWINLNITTVHLNYSGGNVVLWPFCLVLEQHHGGITYFQSCGTACAPPILTLFLPSFPVGHDIRINVKLPEYKKKTCSIFLFIKRKEKYSSYAQVQFCLVTWLHRTSSRAVQMGWRASIWDCSHLRKEAMNDMW